MSDLNYFALDWNQAAEVLCALIVLAIFVERCLALVFESEWYRVRFDELHIKEVIAFVLSLIVCIAFGFDAVGVILKQRGTSVVGIILTAGVIAGGSKASIKLFADVMNIRKLSPKEKELQADLREAKLRRQVLQTDPASSNAPTVAATSTRVDTTDGESTKKNDKSGKKKDKE